MRYFALLSIVLFLTACSTGQKQVVEEKVDVLTSNVAGEGPELKITFTRGPAHYYPLMAIWLESMEGEYLQTLYVPQSIATGIFEYGIAEGREWKAGPRRHPEALPYWGHQRGVQASDGLYVPEPENPIADAYTGATPKNSFVLNTKSDRPLDGKVRLLFEVNQNWDWNEYWTNGKFPGDTYYLTSAQPALVYAVTIDTEEPGIYTLEPIGHSHPSGKDGSLNPDLSTLTTALEIAKEIRVELR